MFDVLPRIATDVDIDSEFHRIAADLTRRGLLATAVGATALGIAGCSPDQDPPNADGPAVRTIEGAYGEITVPAAPSRVVSIGTLPDGALLDVGLTPIAIDDTSTSALPPVIRTS